MCCCLFSDLRPHIVSHQAPPLALCLIWGWVGGLPVNRFQQCKLESNHLRIVWWLASFRTDQRISKLLGIEDWDQHKLWHPLIKTRTSKMGQITSSLMAEIAKFVRFPRNLNSLPCNIFFISWWVNIWTLVVVIQREPFVVRVFGQIASSPPAVAASHYYYYCLQAKQNCCQKSAPSSAQTWFRYWTRIKTGSSWLEIHVRYPKISPHLAEYFCIQIRYLGRRTQFLSRYNFCKT